MNKDERGGLILVGTTLVAGLFIAAAWTIPQGSAAGAFALSALVVAAWTTVNFMARL